MTDHTTVEERLQRPMTSMALAFLGSDEATLCDVHTVAMWCLSQMEDYADHMLTEDDIVLDHELVAGFTRAQVQLETALAATADLPFGEFE